MLLTDKYADKIYGIITCYDRVIIQGYIPNWSHAEAMTTYMKLNGIRIFDYPGFSQPLRNRSVRMRKQLQRRMGLKLNLSENSMHSAKMTASRRSSLKPEKQKAWFIFSLPWNAVILTNHGMIKQPKDFPEV